MPSSSRSLEASRTFAYPSLVLLYTAQRSQGSRLTGRGCGRAWLLEGNLQRETGDIADLSSRRFRAAGPALVLNAFNSSHPSEPSAVEARETEMVPAGRLEGPLHHSIAPAGTVLGVCRPG